MKNPADFYPELFDRIIELEPRKEYFTAESSIHGTSHTRRVMCWTLIIAIESGYIQEGKTAFLAALMHDTARTNDGKCDDHGLWAVEKKWSLFKPLFELFVQSESDFQAIADSCIYHSKWKEAPQNHPHLISINILKDADALDRFRLGEDYFNKKYLRFEQTHQYIESAKKLVQIQNIQTINECYEKIFLME